MSRRLGLTLRQLRELHPAACATDARILMRDGDEHNLSIRTRHGDVELYVSSTRELRLLAKQALYIADYLDRDPDVFEVVE